MEKENYILTCGVFFSFLCHIQLPRKSANEHYLGEGDELTDASMMYEMLRVIKEPSCSSLFDTGTINKFKNCRSSSLGWFNWNDEKMISFFDRQMYSNYNKLKNNMRIFINKTLDLTGDNDKWLVASLLKIITSDSSLDNKRFIYNNASKSKSDFIKQESYDLSSFLLSILHVIVVNKIENTLGRETMDEIAPSAGGLKRTISDDFPNNNYWELHVSFDANKKEPQVEEPEAELIDEVEVIGETSKDTKSDNNVQHIDNATINNVYGDQYNFTGNITINKKG